MERRNKKVLIVLGVASLILVWRVYALLNRSTPTAAQANQAATSIQQDAVPRLEESKAEGETRGWIPLPAAVAAGVAQTPEQSAVQPITPTLAESQKLIAAQPWGRDPFADPPGAVQRAELTEQPKEKEATIVEPPPALKFTGASSSNGKWLAVVRGEIVRVGDLIDGKYKVVEITQRSLTLTANKWTFRYEMGSESPSIRPPSEEP